MSQYLQTIALKDVKCFARHGWYPEEQLIGCWFSVTIETTFPQQEDTENLNLTVNYEQLNQIILDEMKQTRKLLETVVKNILEKIKSAYPFLKTASVTITKHQPPMPGDVGKAVVGLAYKAPDEV